MPIFKSEKDFEAFHRVLDETLRVAPMRICAYCWMTNHWHFVLWPERDGDLSTFMQRMTNMHTQRWQRAKLRVGYGHLYQGRFKSFPVETDEYFYRVVRYVERNALRAGIAQRAEDWRWSSLHRRISGQASGLLAEWPLPMPTDWTQYVNEPQSDSELEAIRRCVQRGCPYGAGTWSETVAKQLGLESTIRPRGRPRQERE